MLTLPEYTVSNDVAKMLASLKALGLADDRGLRHFAVWCAHRVDHLWEPVDGDLDARALLTSAMQVADGKRPGLPDYEAGRNAPALPDGVEDRSIGGWLVAASAASAARTAAGKCAGGFPDLVARQAVVAITWNTWTIDGHDGDLERRAQADELRRRWPASAYEARLTGLLHGPNESIQCEETNEAA